MAITIKLKQEPKICKFTECELKEIVDNLEVCRDDGCEEVYFGECAPRNVCKPWQLVDCDGKNIGMIKYYKDGAWT